MCPAIRRTRKVPGALSAVALGMKYRHIMATDTKNVHPSVRSLYHIFIFLSLLIILLLEVPIMCYGEPSFGEAAWQYSREARSYPEPAPMPRHHTPQPPPAKPTPIICGGCGDADLDLHRCRNGTKGHDWSCSCRCTPF